jgi:hypothetical protein
MTEKRARVVRGTNARIIVNAKHSRNFPPHAKHDHAIQGVCEKKALPFIVRTNSRAVGRVGATSGRGNGEGTHQGRDSVRRCGRGQALSLREGKKIVCRWTRIGLYYHGISRVS